MNGRIVMLMRRAPKLLTAGITAIGLIAVGCKSPVAGPLPISGPIRDAPGQVLFSSLGVFKALVPSTKAVSTLPGPEGAFAGEPTASPDGRLVAFATTVRSPEGVYGTGTDLYLMAPNGTGRRLVLGHDATGVSHTQPAWSPDGRSLYFTRVGPGTTTRIERVRADGSARMVIAADAHSPALSPTGRLALLTSDPKTYTQSLWVLEPGGRRRRLAGHPEFQSIVSPRFSPEGSVIVFAAYIEATPAPRRSDALPRRPWLGRSWLAGPETASAHAVPWDLWQVGVDGSGLTRLTFIDEHVPAPAWSPDGRWIAFTGEYGIYVLELSSKRVRRLIEEVASGGITWVPGPR